MKLPRPLLHAARIADEVLFYPALVVVRGELAPVEPDAFGWLAGINDKLLHFAAYFGLSVMAGAAVRRRKTAILAGLGLVLLGGAGSHPGLCGARSFGL